MSNTEEFKKAIEEAKAIISQRLVNNMETCCFLVERDAKIEAPIDQGLLRSSMVSQVSTEGTKVIGIVGNTLEYAPYVHQGTGIYAVNGDGRKTPWAYKVEKGKYKGLNWTHGQKPNAFLDRAKIKNKTYINRILAGGK